MLIATVLFAPAVDAGTTHAARVEIESLLAHVYASGCEFYRNGTWHDSRAAEAHLRAKYQYLANRNRIDTAEQFIEKAATASSISGSQYEVRCKGSPQRSSNGWLLEELARFRAFSS